MCEFGDLLHLLPIYRSAYLVLSTHNAEIVTNGFQNRPGVTQNEERSHGHWCPACLGHRSCLRYKVSIETSPRADSAGYLGFSGVSVRSVRQTWIGIIAKPAPFKDNYLNSLCGVRKVAHVV